MAVLSVAMLCSGMAMAQTNNATIELTPLAPVMSYSPTNTGPAEAATNSAAGTTNVANLGNVTVIGQLDQARSTILPNLGATAYVHTADQIQSQSQGDNAPLNQVILRSPGVVQDSAVNGDLHVRGEHANLQYRINGVLLPEGIAGGFGLELDPRFIQSMQLITGSLPAQYGFRTAGVIDIETKTGDFQNGGQVGLYGGSYNTFAPSFEYGDTEGKWDYYINGSFNQNDLGLENPTSSANAIHDQTEQYRAFVYASRLMSDTSRLTLMGGANYSSFQIPNTPGLPVGTASDTAQTPWINFMSPPTNTDSSQLNENQIQQNYYTVLAYQKSAGDLNYQLSGFGRISDAHFMPDPSGDLIFNGVASDVDRNLYSIGGEFDASYELGDKHTIRFGGMLMEEYLQADNTTTVFPIDTNTFAPTGGPLPPIIQDNSANALYAGVYVQDEWKILPKFTLNYGARFDEYYSSFDKENQPSPRVNLIYQATDSTTMHVGYSRYFTPPPLENVPQGDIKVFNGTSNQSAVQENDPVKSERANYFDVGVSQGVTKHLQLGVDGYYKYAQEQLDDGLFGQSQILQAFNYAEGRIYGVEGTASYNLGGFSTYANFTWSVAQGQNWSSAQFLFDPASLAYVQNHWIYLDHDQEFSGSFGTSYTLRESQYNSSLFYVDAIYGSGLRQDGGGEIGGDIDPTAPIPNGATVQPYYSINLGMEQDYKIPHNKMLKARIDVVNVTDHVYQLRSGSGVGVNAPQYGMRRGFFGSLTLVF
ncbi:MAG TPA: TonB-dependent receptor [Pseudomonadales bacterium]|nr:TonB-dependent receptor [Pseudomonadales bacterium]